MSEPQESKSLWQDIGEKACVDLLVSKFDDAASFWESTFGENRQSVVSPYPMTTKESGEMDE